MNAMCMFMYLFVVYFSFAPVISASIDHYVNYFDIQVLMRVTETEMLTPTLHHNIFLYIYIHTQLSFWYIYLHNQHCSNIYIYIHRVNHTSSNANYNHIPPSRNVSKYPITKSFFVNKIKIVVHSPMEDISSNSDTTRFNSSISVSIFTNPSTWAGYDRRLIIYHIYPTPLLGQDMTQGQFISGV